jgi:hypothetical protein
MIIEPIKSLESARPEPDVALCYQEGIGDIASPVPVRIACTEIKARWIEPDIVLSYLKRIYDIDGPVGVCVSKCRT